MEKSASKRLCIFPVVAWLLLIATVLLSATSIQSVNGSVSWEWDHSTIGSSVADDQEFLMDSQFGNVLARGGSIGYGALRRGPTCSGKFYKYCIQKGGGNTKNRQCNYADYCQRQSPH